jgi:ribosomal protein S18 acetylase RimI-like enzyme
MGHAAYSFMTGHLVDLRSLGRADLEPLLAEEADLMRDSLHWQPGPLEQGARGIAWTRGDRILGYLTLVLQEGSATLGRCFVSRQGPTAEVESALLWSAIKGAFALPEVKGFFGEILMPTPGRTEQLLLRWPGQVGVRCLMEIPRQTLPKPSGPEIPDRIDPWRQDLLPSASLLLAESYSDLAEIGPGLNGRGPVEARLILESITAGAAAGWFAPEASFVARNIQTMELEGFVLACRMGKDIGHIAQLAVVPGRRRMGLGRTLLVRALDGLTALGCQATHLAVHLENRNAYALYWNLGFRETHRFPELRLVRPEVKLA